MLASFAQSDVGRLYGRTCKTYGLDPGAALEDDVLAFNLNLALLLSDTEDEPEDEFAAAKRKSEEAFA